MIRRRSGSEPSRKDVLGSATRARKAAAAEIAGLAGDGLPNPEIAAPLFIGRGLSSTCCAKS